MKATIEKYRIATRHPLDLDTNWENLRFAPLDSESTGFDPNRDRLISLAGMGLFNEEICLWDQFSTFMPVAYNTSSVTVHGITREAAADGVEEPEAVAQFLDWLGDGVIAGHHIQHDITLLNLACQRHFSITMRNVVLDTMDAFLAVREAGGFPDRTDPEGFSLDALCNYFSIVPHDRHTALGDAFLTAQVLLRILKEASARELWNLRDLRAWYAHRESPHNRAN